MKKILLTSAFLMSSSIYAQDYSFLSPEEKATYEKGDISDVRAVGGGLAGTFVGFGVGHGVVKSYKKIGWVFTVGEVASLGLMLGGIIPACDKRNAFTGKTECDFNAGTATLTIAGAVGVLGFRIWELIDIWTRPWDMQDEFRKVERKVNDHYKEKKTEGNSLQFAAYPSMLNEKPALGVGLQLRF